MLNNFHFYELLGALDVVEALFKCLVKDWFCNFYLLSPFFEFPPPIPEM